MRNCQNCGTANTDEAIFCDMCGLRLSVIRHCPICGAEIPTAGADCSSCSARRQAVRRPITAPLSAAEAPPAQALSEPISVAVFSWAGAGISIPIPMHSASVIGRSTAGAEIALDDYDDEQLVSKRHARLTYRDGRFFLEDLGSTNGTYVGRQRLQRVVPHQALVLEDGDLVAFGELLLRFRRTAL